MKIRAFFISILVICGMITVKFYVKATQSSLNKRPFFEMVQPQHTTSNILSLITRMKKQMEKDMDSFPELIREVENYTRTCSDTASVALLHSMIAEMYHNYYSIHRWKIDQRTHLSDWIPDDIREWSSLLFQKKIKQELSTSLQPDSLLQQTPLSHYKILLKKGEKCSNLLPTLYDFLLNRAIEIQPSKQWFQAGIAFCLTQPDKRRLILHELAYRQYLYDQRQLSAENYRKQLDSLYTCYQQESFAPEIAIKQLNLLEQSYYQVQQWQQDSIQSVIYQFCQQQIAQYPYFERINLFKNKLANMEIPHLRVNAPNNVYPGKEWKIKIKYRNTPQLSLRIYKSLRQPENAWRNYYKQSKQLRGDLVKQLTIQLPLRNRFALADTTLSISMPHLGLYEYEIQVPGQSIRSISDCFSVSRLSAVTRKQGKLTEVLVTDFESGKPMEGATVIYCKTNLMDGTVQRLGKIQTDQFGRVFLPDNPKIEQIRPVFQKDTASLISNVRYSYYEENRSKESIDLSLFTDRKLYRPGQTVYFKGIAYVKESNVPHVVTDQSFTIRLLDANSQEIAHKTCKTDAFGAFHGEFTLPTHCLNGTFELLSDLRHISTTIQVEAYKRPSFQFKFQPLKDEISFGDTILLNGEAISFSGIRLEGGSVQWSITQQPFWFRDYRCDPYNFTQKQVAHGTAQVDSNGHFTVPFTPERVIQNEKGKAVYQCYEIKATLIDSKGETQESNYTFAVGDTGILLEIHTHGLMDSQTAEAVVHAFTINRQKSHAEGRFTLYALGDKQQETFYSDKTSFFPIQTVATGHFVTNKTTFTDLFKTIPSGRYRLVVQANDKRGKVVSAQQDFILYNRTDKRPPVFSHTWLIEEQTHCSPGDTASFIFGTSDEQVHLLYEIFTNQGKCTKRELLQLNQENRKFQIPFTDKDGEGFVASLTFVKQGKLYHKEVSVYRKQPDRRLQITPKTFRDHLLPGNKETWSFLITSADSQRISAQLLASMYDASLDKIHPFHWLFNPIRELRFSAPSFREGSAFEKRVHYESGKSKNKSVPSYQYEQLDWQGVLNLAVWFNRSNSRMLTGSVMKSVPVAEVLQIEDNAAMLSTTDIKLEEEVVYTIPSDYNDSITPFTPVNTIHLRENFAETAFFYPLLVTDSTGVVSFHFTLPESHTTWKLQLLAQTKELKYGYLSQEIISNKPLMVTPNLPRFLRKGDKVTLTAQISNQFSDSLDGKASLDLFDPQTEEIISQWQKSITVTCDSTITVSWSFLVPDTQKGVIGCRISAQSQEGSDGEQHLLPLLSNEILTTESKPFHLFDQQEEVIRLKNGKGIRPFRTTLELTANPIWYAVQALPTLTQPDHDNTTAWFAAYYGNTLAHNIATTHPRIHQIIRQWEAQGGDVNSLQANLKKNEELKNVLLQETPWVLECDQEAEQKQRISLLFDLNRAAAQRETAFQMLLDLQRTDGGWSWFKGMYSSLDMTLYVLRGMSQLTALNAIEYNQQEKEMQIRALTYLDKQIAANYKALQERTGLSRHVITPYEIEYLYVRSHFRDIPAWGETQEAIRYYTQLAEKQWEQQTLRGKGEIAWLMWTNGKQTLAERIVDWLRQTAITSSDKGMHWANNRREIDFLTSPLETHCLLISVLQEISPNKQETDRLKQWLLSQKQTQHWTSIPETVQAIDVLLYTGSDWLKTDNLCSAQWGDENYCTKTGELATGYLKVSHSDKPSLHKQKREILIRKEGNAPAWGAVYEQFFQPIESVCKQKGALHIEKMVFIEIDTENGKELRRITPQQPLRVGDNVKIRLVLRNDREMNYVSLKDLHAGCSEVAEQISGMSYEEGIAYYQTSTDVATHFFFERLPKGTYVLEYKVHIARPGNYSGGICTLQCLYAPEFVSHTEGITLQVTENRN